MSPDQHEWEAAALSHNAQRQRGDEALKMLATAQVHATLAVAGRLAALADGKGDSDAQVG
jgi:hypothetical protein